MPTLKRDICIKIRVTEAERELIAEKMATANIKNREAYLRKMALDGYIVRVDLSEIKELIRLLSNAANNINQIAKRANESGLINPAAIEKLQDDYTELRQLSKNIMKNLAKI